MRSGLGWGIVLGACLVSSSLAAEIDLSAATIVIRQGDLPAAEKIAPVVLTEEIARRTGVTWKASAQWPASADAIVALSALREAGTVGADKAIAKARAALARATTEPIRPDLYRKIDALAVSLFETVGLQTSMERFHASGSERGCVMDFIHYPLNNRWWLEDRFDRIERIEDREERAKAVLQLYDWAVPPEGSFYDDIGNVAESPRAPKFFHSTDAGRYFREIPSPTIRWLGEERRPVRYAWHTYLNRPAKMAYTGLDPQARYTVRLFGQHVSPLEIDGARAKLIRQGDVVEQNLEQEFEVPAEALSDGRLELTWGAPEESGLNWRNRHYVTELWVIKQR